VKKINGIQHIGVAVNDMDLSLKFYRKFFGMDIPFFDSVAAAPLMKVYTRDEVITKRASMILNLQGGCAMEVIRPTSFEPVGPKSPVQIGDLGIQCTQIKCKDIQTSFDFCKEEGATIVGDLMKDPLGRATFYIEDPDKNLFQYVEGSSWYTSNGHHSGGSIGCTIGVSDIDEALSLYAEVLGYDEIVADETGNFDDLKALPGGDGKFRRTWLSQTGDPRGGFAKVAGKTYIELIQSLDRTPSKIFEDRIWADSGFVHLGFDAKHMEQLGEELAQKGFGFTCDSNDALDMGTTKVHCTYIEDRDGTWLELIEVYKVPIVEKFGIFLNVEKRNPAKPLPDFMLKALRFSRIKDR
jgi:catechol 2,3-dioxygenase-like lactoylglutathione lyase family enzyme